MRRTTLTSLWIAGVTMLMLPNWSSAERSDGFVEARKRMVSEQLTSEGRSITNSRVISAMLSVPRHEFVPERWKDRAYQDHPLPIGHQQTISQPYIVAYMTQVLDPKPSDRVLEIGTGSGYQAAILAKLVAEVCSIEIVKELAVHAAATLNRLGYTNVHTRAGDGYAGWPEAAPFDAIIVTCAPNDIPAPLTEQLKEGGKMVIPVGPSGSQELVLLQKDRGRLRQHSILAVRFVPMTGRASDRKQAQ